jgi:hypothetical protein
MTIISRMDIPEWDNRLAILPERERERESTPEPASTITYL